MTDKMQSHINRIVKEKMNFVAQNQEKLVTAWIAETGVHPSEAILVTENVNGKGVSQCRAFVEKRSDREKFLAMEDVVTRARLVRNMKADHPFRDSVLKAFDLAIEALDALEGEKKDGN